MRIRSPVLYKTILADPPWLERGGGKVKRGADRHYGLLHKEEILRVMIESGVWHPDKSGCHLYMWVTNNHLLDGLWVMEKLGFRYVTNIVWTKDRFGLGYYFRGRHELCLFGVMGVMAPLCRNVDTLIEAPRGRHSAKPGRLYEKIEAVSRGPRLEMFARGGREGWRSWGDEVMK